MSAWWIRRKFAERLRIFNEIEANHFMAKWMKRNQDTDQRE